MAKEIQTKINEFEAKGPEKTQDYLKFKGEKLKKEITIIKKKHEKEFKVYQDKMNNNLREIENAKNLQIEK